MKSTDMAMNSHRTSGPAPASESAPPPSALDYQLFPTEIGWIGLIWYDTRCPEHNENATLSTCEPAGPAVHPAKYPDDSWTVHRLTLGHPDRQTALKHLDRSSPRWKAATIAVTDRQQAIVDRITDFAAGSAVHFSDIPVSMGQRTPFQRAVLQACRRVPWGETRTYRALAEMAGYPRAARAVGNVMASNRTPLLIPCHRIIPTGPRSSQNLGGFTAPGGIAMKRRLLELEHTNGSAFDAGL